MSGLRRRAMTKAGEVNHLVFAAENRAVAAGDRIATGVYPFAEDFDLTILFDFDLTSNPTSGTSRLWKLIYAYNTAASAIGLQIGKRTGSGTLPVQDWMGGSYENLGGTSTSAGRHRIAVTHEAGSDTLTIAYRKNTAKRLNFTASKEFIASPTDQLYFGRGENNDYSLPPGTLTAKVYDKILTAEEINAFIA